MKVLLSLLLLALPGFCKADSVSLFEITRLKDPTFKFKIRNAAANACWDSHGRTILRNITNNYSIYVSDCSQQSRWLFWVYDAGVIKPFQALEAGVIGYTYHQDFSFVMTGLDNLRGREVKPIQGGLVESSTEPGQCASLQGGNFVKKACDPSDASQIFEMYSDVTMPLTPLAATPPANSTSLKPQGSGDPHFVNFGGKKFDFHGGCDLVFMHVPEFTSDGKDLSVHIRTKIESWWSYIESVAIKIGDETLEVMGGDHKHGNRYWINGEAGHDFDAAKKMKPLESTLSGYEVAARKISNKQRQFRIRLSRKDAISIDTLKDFVSVKVLANTKDMFEKSVGLMGSFPEGQMLSRNGVMVEDVDEYGKGWQVLSTEPKLFHSYEGTVQHPETCAMPDSTQAAAKKKRRLGESMLDEEAAKIACAGVEPESFDYCVFDVLAVNDKDVADIYKIGPGAY